VLSELTVRGFGIIEEIAWRPAEGLNVITGETGAGKSLVVDAVEALLSGQVQEEDIRHGSDEALIEGVFRITQNEGEGQLRSRLSEKGLEADEDALLITCNFRRQGRSSPRVNRQAVSRALLRDISASLVDIHGQSGHLSLLNKDQHLEFLDAYAHTRELRRSFSAMASELSQAEREVQALSRTEQDMSRQIELLNFQIDEIRRAELQPGEEEELERELALLTSAEKLKAASYEVYRIIYGDENMLTSSSAVDRINEALPVFKQIIETDPSLKSRLNSLEEMVHGLEELSREVRSYGESLNYDPQRLEEVQVRLELIRSLKRKYGGSVDGVLNYLAKAEVELEGLNYSGERQAQLEEKIGRLKAEMGTLAYRLSEERSQAAGRLVAAVKKELADLAMSQVDFDVSAVRELSTDGIPFPDGKLYRFDPTGADIVEFMASTNPGEPLKPLARIASTGEISRFLLALKSALAEADTIPVLIFDEIDIGVGGRSGEVIGRKLWNLSRNHQVICVTHLPQIAAFADAHYNVSKQSIGGRTASTIKTLQGESRLNELAVMVGGTGYTASSLNTARELIHGAETWKSGMNRGVT
jgi:DNA repair protein RecN (Recombination protein N)